MTQDDCLERHILQAHTIHDTVSICAACGEGLDIGATICRFCGEPTTIPDDDTRVEIDVQLLDRLGDWSQIKHEIVENYAAAYTTIVSRQSVIKRMLYVDAFAGAGIAEDRETGELLRGSAIRLLEVEPRFQELHFVEQNENKAAVLEQLTSFDRRVQVHRGDANEVLTRDVLPRCRWEDYHRALCLLDPYGLAVDWKVVHAIGQLGSVEIFYNFMVMDANRNVLWRHPERLQKERLQKMDFVWGDRTWTGQLYERTEDLFGARAEKLPNAAVAEAFRTRLQKVAGFKYVPAPIPMKNTRGATVYYLFFASPNKTGAAIVEDIFNKYRE